MLVALADTHGETDPALTAHLRETITGADCVLHAGDFTTVAVLDGIDALADRLVAVHGNADAAGVRERLPATATVDAFERRILVVHGHEHDRTALSLLARQEEADVVVVGHTHEPGVARVGDLPVVNPGSHADPRGSRPGYAVFEGDENGLCVQFRTPSGEDVESIRA